MQIGMDLENFSFVPRPVCFMFCTENTKPSVTWYRPKYFSVTQILFENMFSTYMFYLIQNKF